ncbi:Ribosomal protein S18 acetylase RimI [Aquimarina amphilecti]|uniref:Ribosomal protein S18 acetylase RimI n=1 Tax=Aquimarina amphilecti TaxID=1038014 RepID=A0A1H7QN12_AQUAM|nr:GNAT family N-acetyltransferase [Aquimarina amphilecti]SEL49306.1 Ribosomal protein S18 acetylase RimI [Aquimarina amphilecti]
MEIKTLEGINKKDILNVFNESFSDYFIPFRLTEEQLISKMLADKTDLSMSVGVFENENLIAFILHGFDIINNKNVLYNGGTGVIPEKRGVGLTKKMYHFILPVLKEKRIDTLQLEVIIKNIQAINSYEKSGYQIERKLICYKGKASVLNINNDIVIKVLEDYNWDLMQSFWDIHPTWQNSKNVLDELKNINVSLGAYIDSKLIGYIIYNPSNKRLHQIAISKDFRNKNIASTLIKELIKTYGNEFSVINVDKKSKPVHTFFENIGLENNLEQLEMKLHLD